MRWDKFLKDIAESYYFIPLMWLIALAVVIMGIIKRRQLGSLKWLVFQAGATLLQGGTFIVTYIDEINKKNGSWAIIQAASQFGFLLLELFFCTLFIKSSIVNKSFKKVIVIYTGLVVIILPLIFFSNSIDKNATTPLFVTENICLTASCLLYFTDLFRQPPTRHLLQDPAFWAISGMLLLFSIGTPLFLLFDVLGYHFALESIYVINYILYCILYLTYLKAIQCSPAKLK
jgi:hypothetical protein